MDYFNTFKDDSQYPDWTVRADIILDIHLYICEITDVRVELSVHARISIVNFALVRNTDIQADIHADIGITDIGARFTMDIRGCTENLTRISVNLRISKQISARTI